MEYRLLCSLIVMTICMSVSSGQPFPGGDGGKDLEVNIVGSRRMIKKPRDAMNLTCQVNQGLQVILTHSVSWIHVSLANHSQPQETVLTTQETLTGKASPSDYKITVAHDSQKCNFTLEVLSVKPTSDGIFKCKVTNYNDPNKIMQDEAHVIVVNDVESVTMQFDGEESLTGEVREPIQREEGRYGVTCSAYGFNPDASIHIFLGDEEQETGGTKLMLDQRRSKMASARRYEASATATKIDLTAANTGHHLRCVAKGGFDGAVAVEASVPLSVIALEPEVSCDKNVSARPMDKFVKIKCTVKHDKVQIDRYSWEIDSTGEVIVPHESSQNYHQIDIVEIDKDTTEVTLDLYQVDEDHFDTFYFLDIFTKSGQKFRTKATLIREEVIPSSAAMAAASLLCCLSVVLSLLTLW